MTKEYMQFQQELQNAIWHLDHHHELALDQRLRGPYLRHFTKLPPEVVPAKFQPQYRVLKNRLEDFFSSPGEGEGSAQQIERQLRGLLATVLAA